MKNEKFIDLKSDYAFKIIFGTESNKEFLIRLLSSLLGKNIRDIFYHNTEQQGLTTDSRRAVFDLFCEDEAGDLFIVEIQKKRQQYFSDRVLYYASFAIQLQADIDREKFRLSDEETRKRWNYQINKVYVVCFLDFIMDQEYPEKYRWDVVRMDRELKIPFNETLNEIYLEMPKFRLQLSECDKVYEKFLYIINNEGVMEKLPKELNEDLYQRLKSAIELQRMSAKERLAYELSIAADRDFYACMSTSFDDGKAEGEAEGFISGVKQVALKLKRKGLDIASITDVTGLSPDVIQAL